MFQVTPDVNGRILWANLFLLFWLSLLPFCTGWVGAAGLARGPVALFGVDLLMAALSYFTLQNTIIAHQGKDSLLAKAVGRDTKGIVSLLLYVAGIGLAVANLAPLAFAVLWLPSLLWLVPDQRIERALTQGDGE
jgi:uncharacterized membrane protein